MSTQTKQVPGPWELMPNVARLKEINAELLEAAETFVAWVDDVWGSSALSPKTLAEYEKTKTVIAKVKGESVPQRKEEV